MRELLVEMLDRTSRVPPPRRCLVCCSSRYRPNMTFRPRRVMFDGQVCIFIMVEETKRTSSPQSFHICLRVNASRTLGSTLWHTRLYRTYLLMQQHPFHLASHAAPLWRPVGVVAPCVAHYLPCEFSGRGSASRAKHVWLGLCAAITSERGWLDTG